MPTRQSRRRLGLTAALTLGVLCSACTSAGPGARTSTTPDSTSATPSTSSMTSASTTAPPATTTPTATDRATGGATASATTVAGSARGSVILGRTLATGIDVPWGLARVPDGDVLVSARDSYQITKLNLTSGASSLLGTVDEAVSNVSQSGEAGLLGIAVSPSFASDRVIYAYYSTASDNRVARIAYDPSKAAGEQLGTPQVIVKGIPHGIHHDGGRLAFGPDGYLYVSTGESGVPALAHDKASLGGKILRVTTLGQAAPGNPFGTLVYSYGHRNVQGLAWDTAGRLWASEFGDKTADELNLITPGADYGWPATQGATNIAGYTSPVAQWGTDEDSPSGIAYADGSIWMAALKGERLWRIPLDGAALVAAPQSFLDEKLGRLRSVLALDDHTLLVTTSNRDGREVPGSGDDKVVVLTVT